MKKSKQLYDEMSMLLTNYEAQSYYGARVVVQDLYNMLVKIQDNWEEINNE